MSEQVRHRPPTPLARPRGLIVACAAMRSNVNVSTIVRAAGGCGIERMFLTGQVKIDPLIARDGALSVDIEVRSSLPPVLRRLRAEGFPLIGLEQTTDSTNLHHFAFPHRAVLVVGNERHGLTPGELELVDTCVEIPVWGLPYSYNAATATAMAMYEYCRQHPD